MIQMFIDLLSVQSRLFCQNFSIFPIINTHIFIHTHINVCVCTHSPASCCYSSTLIVLVPRHPPEEAEKHLCASLLSSNLQFLQLVCFTSGFFSAKRQCGNKEKQTHLTLASTDTFHLFIFLQVKSSRPRSALPLPVMESCSETEILAFHVTGDGLSRFCTCTHRLPPPSHFLPFWLRVECGRHQPALRVSCGARRITSPPPHLPPQDFYEQNVPVERSACLHIICAYHGPPVFTRVLLQPLAATAGASGRLVTAQSVRIWKVD